MKTWRTYSLLILITLTSRCIEPFTPEIKDYEDLLVVEAIITDEASTQFVRLTRSHPLDTSVINFERGATVLIRNSAGNEFPFEEKTQGYYSPEPDLFNPLPGDIYTLSITTFDGRIYNSDPVIMKRTPPIQDLSYERMSVPSNETNDLDDGFQILLNSGTESTDPGYYKFDYEETWELIPLYPSYYDYNSQQGIIAREDNISDCWINSSSTNLNIQSTDNLSVDIIKNHPIRFIPFRESLLNVRYSIRVKQYSLSEEAYYFWKNLKDSNESTGSLYDKQPFQVIGNIRNVNDLSEPVLGYFDMASISSKRIFIDKTDVPEDVKVPSLYANCKTGADTIVSAMDVPVFLERGYLISYFIFMQGYVMAYTSCVDCRLKGTNVKPEFWE